MCGQSYSSYFGFRRKYRCKWYYAAKIYTHSRLKNAFYRKHYCSKISGRNPIDRGELYLVSNLFYTCPVDGCWNSVEGANLCLTYMAAYWWRLEGFVMRVTVAYPGLGVPILVGYCIRCFWIKFATKRLLRCRAVNFLLFNGRFHIILKLRK